ncbi:MAG: hypothetical protein L0207_01050 [Chlamydiae bacterium]|nr:hypothetical protein [Chlamydiota bacterium]
MKLTDEAKRDILNFVLDLVAAIADKEYQKRVWIRGEGPQVDDFDETSDHFLHEGDGVIEKYKDFGITDIQYHLLVNFRNAFETFVDSPRRPYLPEEFIDTPEWAKMMNMAKEVLKAFNYKKKS